MSFEKDTSTEIPVRLCTHLTMGTRVLVSSSMLMNSDDRRNAWASDITPSI